VAWLGSGDSPVAFDPELSAHLDLGLLHARRPKDGFELEGIGRAIAATAEGFAALPSILRPGISEREAQIELEGTMFRAGGERTAYGTIIGFGSNSAIFHFQPSGRRASPGDIVLVDAGADIGGYVADVTRMFPIGGAFGSEAQELYDMLLDAQIRGIDRCMPGAEWHDVHEQTARDLAGGLIELGIIRCSVDEAIERETIALFLPHGVGHMVGLGVRDAGGMLPDRPPMRYCGVTLRVDLPLEEGFVVTVEPGVYFVPALLNDAAAREKHRDAVDWDRAESLIPLGGMRIEDNVHVTRGGPQVLTSAIPK
jgi:Xaa-Pro aminopeptidase